MRAQKFVYSTSGVTDVTSEENRAICAELHEEVAARTPEVKLGAARRGNAAMWPVHSDSMACDSAEQAKQEQEFLKKHGISTEYDSEFRPIWTSARHKKAYQRALGHADPDAGYADAEPVKFHSGIKRLNPNARLEQARKALIEKEFRLFGCRISSL